MSNNCKGPSFKKILKKYSDSIRFYFCDVTLEENQWLHQLLLIQAVPNSYLFSSNGELLSFISGRIDASEVEKQIMSSHAYSGYNNSVNPQFQAKNKDLLSLYSFLIKAKHIFENDPIESERFIESALSLEETFYGLYLKYQLYKNKQDSLNINLLVDRMIEFPLTSFQLVVYESLLEELIAFNHVQKEKITGTSSICFDSHDYHLGIVKIGERRNLKIPYLNCGNSHLVIKDAYTSCDCAEVNFSSSPTLPGQSGYIDLNVITSEPGEMKISVFIISNSLLPVTSLSISMGVFK